MDLREAFGDYRYYLQMNEHRSPRTIASYTADLKRYIAYLEEMGIHAPQQISETDVQDYLIERSEESRPATVSRTLSSLRSFHRFLSLQQPGTLDPTRFLKGPHAALHLPRYLSRTQIEKILNSFGKEDLDIFHQAILELLYGSAEKGIKNGWSRCMKKECGCSSNICGWFVPHGRKSGFLMSFSTAGAIRSHANMSIR